MANGIAVGGFATGLSQGLAQGFGMAQAIDKSNRENEMFQLQKEKMEAERDEALRRKNYSAQVAKGFAEIDEMRAGGVVGGEAEDEFGTPVGKVVYNTPGEAKASGLRFKEGTAVQKPGVELSDFDVSKLRAAVLQKALIDNQLMDDAQFERHRKLNKEFENEGFEEAFNIFERTQDSDAAIAQFNKSTGGKMKAPKGAIMRREEDPVLGADIVVYAPDAKGEMKRIGSRNEYLLMRMPEELVRYYTGMKKSRYEQDQATKRTGMEVKGRVTAAVIGAEAASNKGNKKDEVKKRIDDIVFGVGKAVASNSQNAYDPNQFQQQNEDIATLALKLINEGKAGDEAEAVSMARRQLNVTAPATAIRKPK